MNAPDSAAACHLTLDWLHQHAGIRAANAAVLVDDESLLGVAGVGVPQSRTASIRTNIDDLAHPLVAPMMRNEVVCVQPSRPMRSNGRAHGLERWPHVVLPIWGSVRAQSQVPLGVIVAADLDDIDLRTTRWALTFLASRLAALRAASDRDESERRARASRTLLEAIIDTVPDPVVLTDPEGRLLVANGRAELLFTANEGETEGRRRAVALNNMLFSSALARRGFDTHEPSRRELLLVDPIDGSDLLFELISSMIHDPVAGPGIVSILRNVTDLRRATQEIEAHLRKLRLAEADVRAERDRLDLIIDSVADPILVTDPSGAIVLMNVPAEHLFTVNAASTTEDAQRIVRANDANFSSFVSNLFFSDRATRWRGEIGLIDPASSKPMPVEAIAGKIQSEHGEVLAVVTILHDRTEAIENGRLYEHLKLASSELESKVSEATAELVRQNELLQRQAFELEQASNLKSQFLANVSHEFRTPLNAILGYTSMLLQGIPGELPSGPRKHLTRVDSNARHLLAIINDILDIARIESGRMPMNLSEFALPDLVAEVFAELEPIIQRSQLQVINIPGDSLPLLRSDRQKVKQILLNLLGNALKFTQQGSIHIKSWHHADSDRIFVSVQDTGIGIDERDHEKIFEDFRQADSSTTREYGGTGLGLSICRRLARILSGEITLTSRPAEGSTFTLVIPRRPRRK